MVKVYGIDEVGETHDEWVNVKSTETRNVAPIVLTVSEAPYILGSEEVGYAK